MNPFRKTKETNCNINLLSIFNFSMRKIELKYLPHAFIFRHYYYEKEALVYGFYEENDWKFGLKDRGQNNGYSIKVSSLKALYVTTGIATYPL